MGAIGDKQRGTIRPDWGQGCLSCQEVVHPCCVGFFPRPLLSHLIRLSLPNTMRGGKRAINCGDGGISSNCPNWSDRHFFLRVLIGISYDLQTFGRVIISTQTTSEVMRLFDAGGFL